MAQLFMTYTPAGDCLQMLRRSLSMHLLLTTVMPHLTAGLPSASVVLVFLQHAKQTDS